MVHGLWDSTINIHLVSLLGETSSCVSWSKNGRIGWTWHHGMVSLCPVIGVVGFVKWWTPQIIQDSRCLRVLEYLHVFTPKLSKTQKQPYIYVYIRTYIYIYICIVLVGSFWNPIFVQAAVQCGLKVSSMGLSDNYITTRSILDWYFKSFSLLVLMGIPTNQQKNHFFCRVSKIGTDYDSNITITTR